MGLGLSKGFVIALILSVICAYGMEDVKVGMWIMGMFVVIKVGWQFLTK